MDGVLVEVRGKERLILSVDLLRRSVLVELPFSSVAACAGPDIAASAASSKCLSFQPSGIRVSRTGTEG